MSPGVMEADNGLDNGRRQKGGYRTKMVADNKPPSSRANRRKERVKDLRVFSERQGRPGTEGSEVKMTGQTNFLSSLSHIIERKQGEKKRE